LLRGGKELRDVELTKGAQGEKVRWRGNEREKRGIKWNNRGEKKVVFGLSCNLVSDTTCYRLRRHIAALGRRQGR